MRSTALLFLLVLATIVLAACSGPRVICNKPYMIKGTECCLDSNANGICDADEGTTQTATPTECPKLDCSTCPAQVVSRNVTNTVTKYVCPDGSTAESVEACTKKTQNPFDGYELAPVDGDQIESFIVRPACRGNYRAMEIKYVMGTASPAITVQVKKSPSAQWEDVYTYTDGAMQKYIYGAFCPSAYCTSADFILPSDHAYVIRLQIDYKKTYGVYQFTREVLVDDSEGGEYASKLC